MATKGSLPEISASASYPGAKEVPGSPGPRFAIRSATASSAPAASLVVITNWALSKSLTFLLILSHGTHQNIDDCQGDGQTVLSQDIRTHILRRSCPKEYMHVSEMSPRPSGLSFCSIPCLACSWVNGPKACSSCPFQSLLPAGILKSHRRAWWSEYNSDRKGQSRPAQALPGKSCRIYLKGSVP